MSVPTFCASALDGGACRHWQCWVRCGSEGRGLAGHHSRKTCLYREQHHAPQLHLPPSFSLPTGAGCCPTPPGRIWSATMRCAGVMPMGVTGDTRPVPGGFPGGKQSWGHHCPWEEQAVERKHGTVGFAASAAAPVALHQAPVCPNGSPPCCAHSTKHSPTVGDTARLGGRVPQGSPSSPQVWLLVG